MRPRPEHAAAPSALPMAREVRIGTAGWHLASCGLAEMFRGYAQHFDTVEINNTFDRRARTAFENRRENSPEGFVFALKEADL